MTHSKLLDRFSGEKGRRLVVESLCGQSMIGRDKMIANLLADSAELREFAAGEIVIRQNDADNDLYFVLAGKLKIFVNEREIASRGAGHHVGEMALINPSLRRTATNVAAEPTVVAKISEAAFAKIAEAYPRLWRAIGIELTNRLYQRGAFLSEPNVVPIVFVGSSKESLLIAEALAAAIPIDAATTRLWSKGVFGASHFPIEDLEVQIQMADFAVLVANADDQVNSRGANEDAPRDNVIFELGLFMGGLTFPRFHRHFPTWENEEIGGQYEHEDTTVVYGGVQRRSRAVSPGVRASRRPGGAGSGDCRSSPLPMASGAAAGRGAWTDPTIFTGRAGGIGPAAA